MMKGIFFDLYGTLLIYGDMESAWTDWLSAFHTSLAKFGLKDTESTFAKRCDGFFARTEPQFQEDGSTVLERRIGDFALEIGLSLTPQQLTETASVMIPAWQAYVTLDPETAPVLEKLQEQYKIALITNFDHPPQVHGLVDRFGIRELFDIITVSAELGVSKPDPRIFEPALLHTGLVPEEVAYVGDSIDDDVQGALAAGLRPVHLDRIREDGSEVDFDYRSSGVGSGGQRDRSQLEENGIVIHRLSELLHLFT
jgi:putative hydrolase of the HAD superfamily